MQDLCCLFEGGTGILVPKTCEAKSSPNFVCVFRESFHFCTQMIEAKSPLLFFWFSGIESHYWTPNDGGKIVADLFMSFQALTYIAVLKTMEVNFFPNFL